MPSNELHLTIDFQNVKQVKENFKRLINEYNAKSTKITEFGDTIRRLNVELHTLRFKESQEQRFIWWIWNVYARNVQELLLELEKTTFPVTPFGMSALVKRIKEGTEHIYDGTYLDVP